MIYTPEIRFADIDSYGILHNAKYLIYFEQSRIHLFNKIAGDWDWQKNGVLVASQKIEYKIPVKLCDKLEVEVWVKKVGKKSITIAYKAYKVEGSERYLSAESETVLVCFNPISNKTVDVPILWRESIDKFDLMTRT